MSTAGHDRRHHPARTKPVVLYLGPTSRSAGGSLSTKAQVSHIYTFGYYDQVVMGPGERPDQFPDIRGRRRVLLRLGAGSERRGCPLPRQHRAYPRADRADRNVLPGLLPGDHFEIPHAEGPPPVRVPTATGDEHLAAGRGAPRCELVTRSRSTAHELGRHAAILGLDTGRCVRPSPLLRSH
jgi:hypothetical protein